MARKKNTIMARKKKTDVTPTTAAVASTCPPPPASELSAQVEMQNLKTLNSFLLKETVDLREQIRQRRSNPAAVSENHCIDGAETDLAAETTASPVKKTDVCFTVSREKDVIERDLEFVAGERDLSRRDVDEKRMELKCLKEKILSMEQTLAQNSTSMVVAETEYRKLEEQGKMWEKSLEIAIHEMSSFKGLLEERNVLMVELTRENEKMKEEGKIREESLKFAKLEIDSKKGLLDEKNDLMVKLQRENEKMKEMGKMSEQLVRENEEVKRGKEAEMKHLNAEIEASASKICFLEENCCYLDEIRNQLTDEISHLKNSVEELNEKKSKGRKFKWLFPAAATIFVFGSLAYAARAR